MAAATSDRRSADFYITASQDTWYTALNIAGAGIVSRISAAFITNFHSLNLEIRITIDGTAPTVTTTYPNSAHARDMARSTSGQPVGIDTILDTRFDSSILIEVRSRISSPQPISAAIDYGML